MLNRRQYAVNPALNEVSGRYYSGNGVYHIGRIMTDQAKKPHPERLPSPLGAE